MVLSSLAGAQGMSVCHDNFKFFFLSICDGVKIIVYHNVFLREAKNLAIYSDPLEQQIYELHED